MVDGLGGDFLAGAGFALQHYGLSVAGGSGDAIADGIGKNRTANSAHRHTPAKLPIAAASTALAAANTPIADPSQLGNSQSLVPVKVD